MSTYVVIQTLLMVIFSFQILIIYDSKEKVQFKYQSQLKFLWHDKNSPHFDK